MTNLDNTNPSGDPSLDNLSTLTNPFMEVFSDESLSEATRKKGLQAMIGFQCAFLALTVWKVELKSDDYDEILNELIQPLSVMLDLLLKSYLRTGNVDLLVSSLEETAESITTALQSLNL